MTGQAGGAGEMGANVGRQLEEMAADVLAAARRHGASAADVVVVEADSLDVGVRLGEVEKVKQAREKRLGLRVFDGQRSAVTSTADFSAASLLRLVEDTCALAKVTAPDPYAGLPAEAGPLGELADLGLYDDHVRSVSADEAIAWAQRAEAAAREADPRITNSDGGECSASAGRVVYASTAGASGSYRSSSVSLSAVPIASLDGAMQRDYWYSSKRRVRDLETPEAIGTRAAARALRRLGARSVATCEVPVVFDPEMASGLMRHLAAAVSGTAVFLGNSFLIDRIDQAIAPAFVTVVDDATLPSGLGSKPFDGEGLATRRNVVVENGVLRRYLCDSYAARRLGHPGTASAARSVGGAPQVSTTNFILQPGTASPAEVIGSVSSGLYVTELIGFGINPTTGDYSRGAAGIWIENGELAFPVEEITIAGNLRDMFRDIEVIADDLDLRGAVRAPTLKIRRMTVAGR